MTSVQDWADDVSAYPRGHTVIVGCGNLLRGDDGVGPILIRHLWEEGTFEHVDEVVLVDGGTAGMDVGFKLRGARHAILIDASQTGAEPGTIYEVPGEELAELPPLQGLHSHQFRWDHSLAFSHWLLGDEYPEKVTVYLIEAADLTPGAALSAPVDAAMSIVRDRIIKTITSSAQHVTTTDTGASSTDAGPLTVEFTAEGYLRMTADTAQTYFPNDSMVPLSRPNELWLVPLQGPQSGGLLLKQRTPAGDRATLIHEYFAPSQLPCGHFEAIWDDTAGALRVALGST